MDRPDSEHKVPRDGGASWPVRPQTGDDLIADVLVHLDSLFEEVGEEVDAAVLARAVFEKAGGDKSIDMSQQSGAGHQASHFSEPSAGPPLHRSYSREERLSPHDYSGSSQGTIFVHSSPAAICPHVEWAIAGALRTRADLQWTAQPAAPGQLRAECDWTGDPGTGAVLVSALRAWPMLRFEVTEEPGPGVDGERFCSVPGLGLWRARTSANGDIVVGEDQLRALAATVRGPDGFAHQLDQLLGVAWDDALEPFRVAGEGAPVIWIKQVV